MVTVSFDEVLGATIRMRRKKKLMGAGILAGTMGVRASTWSRMESGRTSFTPSQILAVARALGCSAGTLLEAADRLAKSMEHSGRFTVVSRGKPRDDAQAAKLGMVLGGASVVVGIAMTLLGESAGLSEEEEEGRG
jgi:transcriptional regulator with XRE-family HTH domain